MKNFYSVIANSYNFLYREEQEKKLDIIEKFLKINKNTTILDVGCGTGISLERFQNKCKEIIGLDPNKELLKQCKGKTILGKAEKLPFKDKSFDIVISLTSLHHTNLKKSISEIKRVAKKQIVISFLKKSRKLELAKELLKDFKQRESEKDLIFLFFKD